MMMEQDAGYRQGRHTGPSVLAIKVSLRLKGKRLGSMATHASRILQPASFVRRPFCRQPSYITYNLLLKRLNDKTFAFYAKKSKLQKVIFGMKNILKIHQQKW